MLKNMCRNARSARNIKEKTRRKFLSIQKFQADLWQKVACDFFCLKGKKHLLMIDNLSTYVELKPLNSTTAQSVITVMKCIYATHGIPEYLVSDGGPPYNSNLMMNFFREWSIKHHVTPSHFPRANEQME
ncbi:uncharacterized protein K02A2.6 [Trichonephila inaurata madagascariensis]|uniref:Uncharacterized protein K02A2.6 n=1 Tax=Trichonephila inaurata madagascariensis TaxID=2747483 RepID=A0A8X7BYI7_9ARAC|nr:uncharacterized protein K02A2.6 [Trichonephila inaurata madagascariensis]